MVGGLKMRKVLRSSVHKWQGPLYSLGRIIFYIYLCLYDVCFNLYHLVGI